MTISPTTHERRCPRLGSPVAFAYCMACEAQRRPCWKVMDCWWETFDVVEYLRTHLSPEDFQRLTHARPQPKVATIIELIRQARERTAPGRGDTGDQEIAREEND